MLPITPKEVFKHKLKVIPPEAIDCINKLIVEKATGNGMYIYIYIKMYEIKKKLEELPGYNSNWLNFEGLYAEYGWKVTCHSPSYDEEYDSYYEFRPKKAQEIR